MEMYADEDSRGGVLEPEGIVNIKYRRDKQLDTMARLDPTYGDLRRQLADKNITQEQQSDIKVKMNEREELLGPVYTQISLQFADLHDRAGRMKAKGTIRQALRWENARRFFYWRVRRRLTEEHILKMMNLNSTRAPNSRDRNLGLLQAWSKVTDFEHDDRAVAVWYDENKNLVQERIEAMKQESVAADVATLLRSSAQGGLKGLQQFLSVLPTDEKEKILKSLK